MDSADESEPKTGRRTRSRKTAAAASVAADPPKRTTRRTRKKVVVETETEASDEEAPQSGNENDDSIRNSTEENLSANAEDLERKDPEPIDKADMENEFFVFDTEDAEIAEDSTELKKSENNGQKESDEETDNSFIKSMMISNEKELDEDSDDAKSEKDENEKADSEDMEKDDSKNKQGVETEEKEKDDSDEKEEDSEDKEKDESEDEEKAESEDKEKPESEDNEKTKSEKDKIKSDEEDEIVGNGNEKSDTENEKAEHEIEDNKKPEVKLDSKEEESEKMDVDDDEFREFKEVSVSKSDDDEEDEKVQVNGVEEEVKRKEKSLKNGGDPDAENISEDELPGVPVAKVPETEEVSDEELPGPKRAELPADTEVVSEDELPTVKKESSKRKLPEGEYDPCSPTSEGEAPAKKPALEKESSEKEKEEKPAKPKKLPELDKFWKAVNDDPTDFTGWTYLLQYVDQENDMEAAREAYDAFLSHYPYCYGYWRKYADYEKRKGNKKKCEEVFERGLKAIPLSVDLWIHYLTYVKTTKTDDEEFVRSQFERALTSCGLEFRSDRLWDSYIKWETEAKRLQKVTGIYDRLLATPTQGYTAHFESFQEHVTLNPPNKVVDVDEFLALRKEVRAVLKHDAAETAADTDAPPGDEDSAKVLSTDEETKAIRERIVSIRRKIHKNTVTAVSGRWNFEEGIKRPYFHVKPLERCQLKNWQEYLDYEIVQGEKSRIIVLFERCLIACALYEEFWLKFVHYLEGLKEDEHQAKIRDVYERACTIHHLKKPNLHLQWAIFEESQQNFPKAAEILVNLERSVPNVIQVAYRRINLERRRDDHEKCQQLFEQYIGGAKNKILASNIAIKYSRFCFKVMKNHEKAEEVLRTAITKDPNNPRLYLQLIDLTLQKENLKEEEIIAIMDQFLEKESADADQKILFAQRKLEYLEDFSADITSVQKALEDYQKYCKLIKDGARKKETKSEGTSSKKEKSSAPASAPTGTYGPYGQYGNSPAPNSYQYAGSQPPQGQYNYPQYGQGGEQYQYQNWQYPQGGYGGYNQWGSYGGGYGY